MPVRELYKTEDGGHYPLYIDINDVIKTLITIYWSKEREDRKKIGMMFRGQANAEWSLVPTLFRSPADEKIIKRRLKYTHDFMDALVKNADHLNLKNLSKLKLLAIAQHYGFYTHLLDFSRNIEVAAYFASRTEHPPRIGAIFAYPINEYNELRNPLAALGTSLEETEKLLGDEALPPLLKESFEDVPRSHYQEGLFIECPFNKTKTVQNNCIDRYYFYQRPGLTYQGQFAFETGLLGPSKFASKDAYIAYMEIARREYPELFQQTFALGSDDLFPPVDPLSKFAVEWKKANPDPTVRARTCRKLFSFFGRLFDKAPDIAPDRASVLATTTTPFAAAVNNYYFDRERRTPYESSVIQRGRELIESLCQYKELDDENNQRWLLWEVLRFVTEERYTCGVKLNNRTSTGHVDTVFHLFIYDTWLEGTYILDIPVAQAHQGFWQVRFDKTNSARWEKKPEIHVAPQLFSLQKQYQPIKGNPYRANAEIRKILASLNKKLKSFAPGEDGSFVYDLQCILMKCFGRDLQVILGMGNTNNCCFYNPSVDMNCEKPHLIVEIYDGFFHALKCTSICSKHWKRYSEGEINLFNTSVDFSLGLA